MNVKLIIRGWVGEKRGGNKKIINLPPCELALSANG